MIERQMNVVLNKQFDEASSATMSLLDWLMNMESSLKSYVIAQVL